MLNMVNLTILYGKWLISDKLETPMNLGKLWYLKPMCHSSIVPNLGWNDMT